MDKQVFISKVFVKRPIWDKRMKEHSNRNVVDACWRDIGKEMNINDAELRKKWKYLRDQFSVEYGKLQQPRSGDAGGSSQQTTWPYFNSLLFLKDIVKPRSSSSNLKVTPKATGQSNMSEGVDTNEEIANNSEVQIVSEQTEDIETVAIFDRFEEDQSCHERDKQDLPKKRKRPHVNSKFNETIIDLEKKKTKFLEEVLSKREKDCEDLMFFKSLLPFVKQIPMKDKLVFRNKIQDVVNQFAFPYTQSNPSNESLSSASFTYLSNTTSILSPTGSSGHNNYFLDHDNVVANDDNRRY